MTKSQIPTTGFIFDLGFGHWGLGFVYRPMLVRWLTFNTVGAMGVVVQLACLWLFREVVRLPYLVATAAAVELAVLHNFAWHLRWTWRDRPAAASKERLASVGAPSRGWGPPPPRFALRRGSPKLVAQIHATSEGGAPLKEVVWRLVRFHASNGAFSIAGNVVLMGAFLRFFPGHYLLANLASIGICSLINFVAADVWTFRQEQSAKTV